MTIRELIDALEALDVPDDTPVQVYSENYRGETFYDDPDLRIEEVRYRDRRVEGRIYSELSALRDIFGPLTGKPTTSIVVIQ